VITTREKRHIICEKRPVICQETFDTRCKCLKVWNVWILHFRRLRGVCIYVCKAMNLYVHVRTRTYKFIYVHIDLCISFISSYGSLYIHLRTWTHTFIYAHIYLFISFYIYTYRSIYIHLHTYIHTPLNRRKFNIHTFRTLRHLHLVSKVSWHITGLFSYMIGLFSRVVITDYETFDIQQDIP